MILQSMKDMTAGMLLFLPFVLVFQLSAFFYRTRRGLKTTLLQERLLLLFWLWTLGLLSQTILPELLAALKTGFHWDGRINWTPFAAFRQALTIARRTGDPSFFLLNIPGNILIFLPLGLLPPLLWGKMEKLWKTALFGFGVSLFIEVTQLILPRGTDVDDLLLNTFGTLLGYALFALIRKRFPNFPARCRHRPAAERNALWKKSENFSKNTGS